MITAVKYIEPMKKGQTKPQLFECSNGKQYVVKFFSDEVMGKRLVHEYIANELAKHLGLPIAEGEVIYLDRNMLETNHFAVELGPHFGCVYYKNKARPTNEERIKKCINLHEMPGVIVFDHWIRNRDRANNNWNLIIDEGMEFNKLYMIDQGGAFYSSRRNSETLKKRSHHITIFWGKMYKQFKPFLKDKEQFYQYIKAIQAFPYEKLKEIVYSTPVEWEPNKNELEAILEYLNNRKLILTEPMEELLQKHIGLS